MDISIDSPLSSPMSIISDVSSIELKNQNSTQDNVAPVSENLPMINYHESDELRSIKEIDHKYRHIFHYPHFNRIQSKIMDDVLHADKSVVVSAPTGSGKTVIFEMAIVRFLQQIEKLNYEKDFKIVYLAPIKALCTERLVDWYKKFAKHGLSCIEVTGDSDTLAFSQLKSYKIIMTTPEKWISLTRKWKDNQGIIEIIKLFIIDEIHLLNEDVRGPVLEAIVSRMKLVQETLHSMDYKSTDNERQLKGIRFIAASATIPNVQDIADWLSTKQNPAIPYSFGEDLRPVKLKKVIEAYPSNPSQGIFKFDLFLNYKIRSIIEKYCDGKPTLIFCNTRKGVLMTAETLSKEILFQFSNVQAAKFTSVANRLSERKLQVLLLSGIGCHHAGLLQNDRILIEQLFRDGDLPILITTSTLAMGVNLPAHLVIIKTTQHYVNGAFVEYEESSILQMMGRAGRPQYDTQGVAVIMTRTQDKARYENLCSGTQPVESKLHKHLAEHLNAEIALGTLTDLLFAMDWLRSTFLYVRAKRNPTYYGCKNMATHEDIEKKLQEICVKCINALTRVGLVIMDDDTHITPTETGSLMAMHCLDLDTMKLILKIKGNESLNDLLKLVSECHEFEDVILRTGEKRHLNQLNKNARNPSCRFPQPGKIQNKHMKANCLIQAVLGCLPILDPSLNRESVKILRIGENIARCIVAYLTRPTIVDNYEPIYKALLNSIILNKCFIAKMWDNSQFILRQLNGIGPTYASLLASAGKTTFESIKQSNPRDIERIINKSPPAGNNLQKQVANLPVYSITLGIEKTTFISLDLSIVNYQDIKANVSTTGNSHKISLIVGDSENNLLYFTTISDYRLIHLPAGTSNIKFLPKLDSTHTIYAHCVSNSWVGLDINTSIKIKKSKNQVPTGLYDIRFYMKNHNESNKSSPTSHETESPKKSNDNDVIESSQHTDFKTNKKKSVNNSIAQSNSKKRFLKDQECEKPTKIRKNEKTDYEINHHSMEKVQIDKENIENYHEISDEQSYGLFYNDNDHDTPSNMNYSSKEYMDSYETWKKQLTSKRDEICKSSPLNKERAHHSNKTMCNKQTKNKRLKSLEKTPPITSYWQKTKNVDCSSLKDHDDNKNFKSNSFEVWLNSEFLNPFNDKSDFNEDNLTSINILKTSNSSLVLNKGNTRNTFYSTLHNNENCFASSNILSNDDSLVVSNENTHNKFDFTKFDENALENDIAVTDAKEDDFLDIVDYIINTKDLNNKLSQDNSNEVQNPYRENSEYIDNKILDFEDNKCTNENQYNNNEAEISEIQTNVENINENINNYSNNSQNVIIDGNCFASSNILNTDSSLFVNNENVHDKLDFTLYDGNEDLTVTAAKKDDFQNIIGYINKTNDSNDDISQNNPNEMQSPHKENSKYLGNKILNFEDDNCTNKYQYKNNEAEISEIQSNRENIDEDTNNYRNNSQNDNMIDENIDINEGDHENIDQINTNAGNNSVELNNIIQLLEKTEDKCNAWHMDNLQIFSGVQNNDIINLKHNFEIVESELYKIHTDSSIFPRSNEYLNNNLTETHKKNDKTEKKQMFCKGRYANSHWKCENTFSNLLKIKKQINYLTIQSEEYSSIRIDFYIKRNSIFFNHLKQFISYEINRSLIVPKKKNKTIAKVITKSNINLKIPAVEIKKSPNNEFEVTAEIDRTQIKDKEIKQSNYCLINNTENTTCIEKLVNTVDGNLKVSVMFKTPDTEKYENKKKMLKQSPITVPKNKHIKIETYSKSTSDAMSLPSKEKEAQSNSLQTEIAKVLQHHASIFKKHENTANKEENIQNNVNLTESTFNENNDTPQKSFPRTCSIRDIFFYDSSSSVLDFCNDKDSPKHKTLVHDYIPYLSDHKSDDDSVSNDSNYENSLTCNSDVQGFSDAQQFLLNTYEKYRRTCDSNMYSPKHYNLYIMHKNKLNSEIWGKKRKLMQNTYYENNGSLSPSSTCSENYLQDLPMASSLESIYADSFEIIPERYKLYELKAETLNLLKSKPLKEECLKLKDLKQFEITPKKRMY